VTCGCGQGTLFNRTLDKLHDDKLPRVRVRQSTIYQLLQSVAPLNHIYRLASSVHCCCLCQGERVLMSVEDVARHNAADAIAGRMWLDDIPGEDKILFSTCRLTSEIITKVAFMGIPVLVSKSGMTHMGLELARNMGMVVIGRAEASRFLVFNGGEQVEFDATPQPGPS
jgi:FdhD protein